MNVAQNKNGQEKGRQLTAADDPLVVEASRMTSIKVTAKTLIVIVLTRVPLPIAIPIARLVVVLWAGFAHA
jgi:hypothetical protein